MIREVKISDYDELSKLFLQHGHPLPEKLIKENIKKVINEERFNKYWLLRFIGFIFLLGNSHSTVLKRK